MKKRSAIPMLVSLLGLLCASPGAADLSSYPRVRVDLRAGALLDPLPFDEPFLITGEVPASTRSVEARVEEYLEVFAAGDDPASLARIGEQARAFLDSTLVRSSGGGRRPELRWIQQRLAGIVAQEANVPSGLGGRVLPNLVPWNWGNLGLLFRRGRSDVVAPGTVLDPDGFPEIEAASFNGRVDEILDRGRGYEREQALDGIVEAVVSAARSARIGIRSSRVDSRSPVRWNRLKGPELVEDEGQSEGILPRWNRLESLDSELDLGAAGFQLLVPPLKADRTYVIYFRFDRSLTAWETNALRASVEKRLEEVATGTGTMRNLHQRGERLRKDLLERLNAAAGGGRVSAEGTAFDPLIDYERVHPFFGKLIERVSEGGEQTVAAADEVARMVQGRRVTARMSAIASTSANNYVGADIGLAYAGALPEYALYIGANFYLRPVNKGVPLSRRGGFARRFAFTVGLTLQGIDDEVRTRENLFHNQSLLVGAGYRFAQFIRAGAGLVLFRERNPDTFPLTEDTRLAVTPYVSVSIDADIGQQLKGLGGIFDFLKDNDDDS